MNDNRNLILFFVLAGALMLGWSVLFPPPEPPQDPAAIGETNGVQTVPQQADGEAGPDLPAIAPGQPGTAPGAELPGLAGGLNRDAALAQSPRVAIDAPEVLGSVNLKGGRIDDLQLRNYYLTPDPDGCLDPEVVAELASKRQGEKSLFDPVTCRIIVLSPEQAQSAYYAQFGWTATGGTGVPGPDTVWTQANTGPLTPQNPLELTWENGAGLTFLRTITIDNDFMFAITQEVRNASGAEMQLAPYGQLLRHGTPDTTGFWFVHEGPLGVFDSVKETESYKTLREETAGLTYNSTGGWLGITDKYWLAALIPAQETAFNGRFKHTAPSGASLYFIDYLQTAQSVPANGSLTHTTHFFAGAKIVDLLDRYEQDLGITRFDLAVDWGGLFFLTRPMFGALKFFQGLIGNFGVAILLFTVLVKLLFFPLANKAYASMSKMKKVQPEMMKIRERYKDDAMKQQQEMMALYKREKLNPMAGCFPILIQIPVFFALYIVLVVTIEMRHAPFFGWIQDLSAPDPTTVFNLFGLLPFDPTAAPLIGPFLGVGVWPLFMGLTMWAQMNMNPTPTDPIQQKVFAFMPIIFTFILAPFASGLVIYWAWNNFLSLLQQYAIMRRMGVPVELGKKIPLPAGLSMRLFGDDNGQDTGTKEGAKDGPKEKAPAAGGNGGGNGTVTSTAKERTETDDRSK